MARLYGRKKLEPSGNPDGSFPLVHAAEKTKGFLHAEAFTKAYSLSYFFAFLVFFLAAFFFLPFFFAVFLAAFFLAARFFLATVTPP